MTGKTPQERGNLRQAQSQWAIREGLRGLQRRGRKLTPRLCHGLSFHSFCKILLISWLLCSPCLTQPENDARGSCGLILEQMAPGGESGQRKNIHCFLWDLLCHVDMKQTLELKPTLTRDNPCVSSTIICKWCQFFMTVPFGHWLLSFTYILCISTLCISAWAELNRDAGQEMFRTLLWEMGHLSSPSRSCLGRFSLIPNGRGALWVGPPTENHCSMKTALRGTERIGCPTPDPLKDLWADSQSYSLHLRSLPSLFHWEALHSQHMKCFELCSLKGLQRSIIVIPLLAVSFIWHAHKLLWVLEICDMQGLLKKVIFYKEKIGRHPAVTCASNDSYISVNEVNNTLF